MLLLCTAFVALAQQDNSPYSRFGIGNSVNQNFAASIGMGSLWTTFNDPFHLNTENPASLSALKATSYEVAMFGKYANLDGGANNADVWSGGLNALALGFPVLSPLNKALERDTRPVAWGMSFALQPYTSVGYEVNYQDNIISATDTLVTDNFFQGSGGSYRLMWGNGVSYKKLSGGISMGLLFGNIINNQRQSFPLEDFEYLNDFQEEISLRAFVWNGGVQYRIDLDDKEVNENGKQTLVVGVTGHGNHSLNTNSDRVIRAFNSNFNDADTTVSVTNLQAEGTLPAEFAIGLMYEKKNKLNLGIQFSNVLWSNYENKAKPEALSDTYRIAIGGTYIPDHLSYNSYGKKIRYRMGLFYETDPRSETVNTNLTNYGLTIGFGFPIILQRGGTSFVSTALEVGQFGNADAINETYARPTVGFTLNDNSWFFKRKYN